MFHFFSDIENVLIRGGGGEYQDFQSKIICLTVLKKFVGETFRVSLILGTEKVLKRWGGIKIFRRNIFVSQCRKISYGNLFVFH